MCNVPDNYACFSKYDAEAEYWLRERPICDCCGEPIQDDFCYDILGEIYCETCIDREFRKEIEEE